MARKTIKGLEAKVTELEQKLTSAQQGERNKQADIESLTREVQSQKDKLFALNDKLAAHQVILSGVEQEKTRNRNEWQRRDTEKDAGIAALRTQLRDVLAQGQTLREDYQKLANKLSDAEKEAKVRQEFLDDVIDQRDTHEASVRRLAEEIFAVKKAHERAMYALGTGLGGRVL